MNMRTIKNTVFVNAPKEKVWQVLFDDQYNRSWYAEFSEGTYAETDWKTGSKVIFKDQGENGLIGTIVISNLYELLAIEYTGILIAGKENYDSPDALAMKGGKETYQLTEKDGGTTLMASGDMGEEYYDFMSEAWQRALKKIISIAESI